MLGVAATFVTNNTFLSGRTTVFLAANKLEGMSNPVLCETDVLLRFINSHESFLTSIIISNLCLYWYLQGYLSRSLYLQVQLEKSSKCAW